MVEFVSPLSQNLLLVTSMSVKESGILKNVCIIDLRKGNYTYGRCTSRTNNIWANLAVLPQKPKRRLESVIIAYDYSLN